jgi:hypothetical protein
MILRQASPSAQPAQPELSAPRPVRALHVTEPDMTDSNVRRNSPVAQLNHHLSAGASLGLITNEYHYLQLGSRDR